MMSGAAAEPTAARGIRARLVDDKIAAAYLARIQLRDRVLRVLVARHLDERKTTGPASRLVTHDGDRFDRSGSREQFAERRLIDLVGQISNVQLPTHKHRPLCRLRDIPDIGIDVGLGVVS